MNESFKTELGNYIPLYGHYTVAYPFLFAIVSIFIVWLFRQPLWHQFSREQEWPARIATALLLLALVFTAQGTAGWLLFGIRSQLAAEEPSSVTTAYKLALYRNAYLQNLETVGTPAQAGLAKCAAQVVQRHALAALQACKDQPSCDLPPPLTRAELRDLIGQAQRGPEGAAGACGKVDFGAL